MSFLKINRNREDTMVMDGPFCLDRHLFLTDNQYLGFIVTISFRKKSKFSQFPVVL